MAQKWFPGRRLSNRQKHERVLSAVEVGVSLVACIWDYVSLAWEAPVFHAVRPFCWAVAVEVWRSFYSWVWPGSGSVLGQSEVSFCASLHPRVTPVG